MEAISDGRRVRYEIRGSGHRTLLLVPALGANSVMWEPQLSFFSNFMRVPCETGGHYPLGNEATLSLADRARDLIAVMDAIGTARADVVGSSLGGIIAQEMALCFPDRVRSLILVSTTSSYPAEARRQLLQRAETAEREGMSSLVEPTLHRWFTRQSNPEADSISVPIRDMLLSADPGSYAAAARAAAGIDTADRLPALKVPTLIITGDLDPSLPPEAARILAERISGARSVVLENAAHLCNLEAADAFNEHLAHFLGTLRGDESINDIEPMSPW